MAGGFEQDNDDVIASINMVPFIDVSLVLLIIFLVTSSYIVSQAIQVDLPQAASGSETTPSTLAVVLEANGNLSFNGEGISWEQLPERIATEVGNDESVQAIIAADRGVDYGRVMDIIDEVKQGGVASFALNIEREASTE